MEQEPITQRVKFLAESLGESVRSFGLAIGEKQTTTSNYITGRNKPSADFLEKIVTHFRNVSAHWLLTGEGEPFLADAPKLVLESNSAYQKNKKNVGGQYIGKVNGNATYHAGPPVDERAAMQRELERLSQQVAERDRTIADKEEIIALLKSRQPKP